MAPTDFGGYTLSVNHAACEEPRPGEDTVQLCRGGSLSPQNLCSSVFIRGFSLLSFRPSLAYG
jgi:hypothetical protein